MSKLQFESLRHQISHFVHESREPLVRARLQEMCDMAVDEKQLAGTIFAMCRAGELVKHPAPEGSGQGVRFAYGPGKKKPGAEAPRDNDAGGAPRAKGGRREAKGKKPAKRKNRSREAREVQRRSADSRPAPNDRSAARWALTEDGAFVLLGTAVEIPRAAALPLVDVVRRTGGTAAFAALAAFIERLDKQEA